MILKNYLIKRKIGRLLSSGHRRRCFRSLDGIERVLLFYRAADAEAAGICADRLKKLGKQVYTCSYRGAAPPSAGSETHIGIDPKTDLDRRGIPAETLIDRLDACRPDLLVDLTREKDYVMQYLLLKCRCDFKAGIKSGEDDRYDFTLAGTENKDLVYLFEQIIFYLQTIRSK